MRPAVARFNSARSRPKGIESMPLFDSAADSRGPSRAAIAVADRSARWRRAALPLALALLVVADSPSLAFAQVAKAASRVVMISNGSEESHRPLTERFLAGMSKLGHVEGRTFAFVLRAAGDPSRTPAVIREVVADPPAVLIVAGLTAARAARQTTATIPIVVATSSDLVDAGLARSLARPGGNVTGVSDLADQAAVKRLELLKAALPNAKRIVLLVNPDFPATPSIEARVRDAAPGLGVTVTPVRARDGASLKAGIEALAGSPPDAILVGGDALFVVHARELIDTARSLRIPVAHYWPDSAERGAMLSHQVDVGENYERAASYVDRILRGANPGDLAIHQPARYELVVNAKAARALGIELPTAFLLRADRVIE